MKLEDTLEEAICFWKLELMGLIIFSVVIGIIIGYILA